MVVGLTWDRMGVWARDILGHEELCEGGLAVDPGCCSCGKMEVVAKRCISDSIGRGGGASGSFHLNKEGTDTIEMPNTIVEPTFIFGDRDCCCGCVLWLRAELGCVPGLAMCRVWLSDEVVQAVLLLLGGCEIPTGVPTVDIPFGQSHRDVDDNPKHAKLSRRLASLVRFRDKRKEDALTKKSGTLCGRRLLKDVNIVVLEKILPLLCAVAQLDQGRYAMHGTLRDLNKGGRNVSSDLIEPGTPTDPSAAITGRMGKPSVYPDEEHQTAFYTRFNSEAPFLQCLNCIPRTESATRHCSSGNEVRIIRALAMPNNTAELGLRKIRRCNEKAGKRKKRRNEARREGAARCPFLGLQNRIGRARKYGWPNTNVFTKAMGEMLLGQMTGNLPVVLLRPTIITSTYKEPFPGWVEGIRYNNGVAIHLHSYKSIGKSLQCLFTIIAAKNLSEIIEVEEGTPLAVATSILATPDHSKQSKAESSSPKKGHSTIDMEQDGLEDSQKKTKDYPRPPTANKDQKKRKD
ncbi:hypothetical protein Vadar_030613 [Vaccinium darrowii]|uniref:Uncharacterized protein n=1 Tax=Vaccinium darrowii TaxID=229202 RepID=A0ACB7Y358_9ERIC|nr:hypothetical protein Vadar_030613 [Vaccinium darrowii]